MKYIKTISVITLAMALSGCASVKGPSGAKFDLKTVCNTSAGSHCSPTLGRQMALLKQQIILETYVENNILKPKLETYLGTITQRGMRRYGEPGTYCGDETVESNPFKPKDFTQKAVYTNHATIAETFGNYSSVAIEADIKEALRLAGVTKPVLDKLENAIETESNKLSRGVSASTVKFVEYRIKEEALRKVEAAYKSNSNEKGITRFKSCIDILLSDTGKKNKGWRLYQSITGFIVTKNTSSFGSNSSFSAEFRAALRSKIESAMKNETQPDTIEAVPTLVSNPVPKEDAETQQIELPATSASNAEAKVESVPQNNFAVTNSLSDNDCNIAPSAARTESENIVKIEATYKSYRCARTTGKSEPYFVVLGVSFWQSPRYPKIR